MLPVVLLSPDHLAHLPFPPDRRQPASGDRGHPGTVVALGNFDGVHRGHRHLLDVLVHEAHARGLPSVVYTFDPLPGEVLRPGATSTRLQPISDRIGALGDAGVDVVCVERFNRSYARRSARWFLEEVLHRHLKAQVVVGGRDIRFGADRDGDAALLGAPGSGLVFVPVDPLRDGTGPISSSRVRGVLGEGDVGQAWHLLGRPHGVDGTVVTGDQRGRQIGFPTANVVSESMLPAFGVYACLASVDGGPSTSAVAHVGTQPTFDGDQVRCEAHLLDVSLAPDGLYGRHLRLQFHHRVRGTLRFASVQALVDQIHQDIARARELLGR